MAEYSRIKKFIGLQEYTCAFRENTGVEHYWVRYTIEASPRYSLRFHPEEGWSHWAYTGSVEAPRRYFDSHLTVVVEGILLPSALPWSVSTSGEGRELCVGGVFWQEINKHLLPEPEEVEHLPPEVLEVLEGIRVYSSLISVAPLSWGTLPIEELSQIIRRDIDLHYFSASGYFNPKAETVRIIELLRRAYGE